MFLTRLHKLFIWIRINKAYAFYPKKTIHVLHKVSFHKTLLVFDVNERTMK